MGLFKTFLGTSTDYANASNWLSNGTAGVPAAGDFVTVPAGSESISLNLDQSAVVLGSFTVSDSYTGSIGNTGLSGAYLKIASPIVNLHVPSNIGTPGSGSPLLKLDLGSTTAAAVTIFGSASSGSETGLEPIRLIGTNANNTLVVEGGTVGIATTNAGEVATIQTASINSGTLNMGGGVTLGNLTQDGGAVNLSCGATTIANNSGDITTYGSGAVTTFTVDGSATLNSTGTITTLNVGDGGVADLKVNRANRTVTTVNLYKGSTIRGGAHITVGTFNLVECGLGDVTIEWDGSLAINYVR